MLLDSSSWQLSLSQGERATIIHALALILAFLLLWKLAPRSRPSSMDDYTQGVMVDGNVSKLRPRSASSDTEVEEEDDDSKEVNSDLHPVDATLADDKIEEDRDEELSNQLLEKVTDSTPQERQRFLATSKGNLAQAASALQNYLSWRAEHAQWFDKEAMSETLAASTLKTIPEGTSAASAEDLDEDAKDWEAAVTAARLSRSEKNLSTSLPRVARMDRTQGASQPQDVRDRDGFRVILIRPGLMDERIIKLTTFSLAIALYIDRKLARDALERVTLVIDVRGGEGWRSLNGAQLLPFIQQTVKLLLTLFPERLARVIVYPIPPAFSWVWTLVKGCMDRATADAVCPLTGPATKASPPPSEAMKEYLDEQIVDLFEKIRLALFVTPAR